MKVSSHRYRHHVEIACSSSYFPLANATIRLACRYTGMSIILPRNTNAPWKKTRNYGGQMNNLTLWRPAVYKSLCLYEQDGLVNTSFKFFMLSSRYTTAKIRLLGRKLVVHRFRLGINSKWTVFQDIQGRMMILCGRSWTESKPELQWKYAFVQRWTHTTGHTRYETRFSDFKLGRTHGQRLSSSPAHIIIS